MSEEIKEQKGQNSLDDSLQDQDNELISSEEPNNEECENLENQNEQNQQEQEEKSFFEGKQGKEYTYGLKYDDVNKGLALLANSKKSKSEKTQDIIISICAVVSLVTSIVTRNMMAIAAVCLCLGYVYYKIMKPVNFRRRAARLIDSRNDEYKAVLYDNGIKIVENGNKREFLYNTLTYRENNDLMLVTKDGLVMILPKRYFGEDVETIKEAFKDSFKSYNE